MKKGLRSAIGMTATAAALTMSVLAALSSGAESAPAAEEGGYMLREYCGRVGVYMHGGTEPISTTDIELKNLPAADRAELHSGIYIENGEELAKILEDLGS